jgi:glycosyltransferase involved in cell wall biosynthesis
MVPSKYKDEIIFAGQRADVPTLLKSCDVLFLPSLGEGLPGVVMEAAASGKPSIATNEGCTADIVIHGKTGYLAEPFKTEQYYGFLAELIKSRKLRESMGKAARSHIKNFEWSNVVKKYEKLYEEVMKQ